MRTEQYDDFKCVFFRNLCAAAPSRNFFIRCDAAKCNANVRTGAVCAKTLDDNPPSTTMHCVFPTSLARSIPTVDNERTHTRLCERIARGPSRVRRAQHYWQIGVHQINCARSRSTSAAAATATAADGNGHQTMPLHAGWPGCVPAARRCMSRASKLFCAFTFAAVTTTTTTATAHMLQITIRRRHRQCTHTHTC